MTRQAELFQVVLALHAVGGLTHLLHGRQKQAHQNGNDRNDHQQLDECERPFPLQARELLDPQHGTTSLLYPGMMNWHLNVSATLCVDRQQR